MKKLVKIIVECIAYLLEKMRMRKFLAKNGMLYTANHRIEWLEYARNNSLSKFAKK